jgi:pectate lyase
VYRNFHEIIKNTYGAAFCLLNEEYNVASLMSKIYSRQNYIKDAILDSSYCKQNRARDETTLIPSKSQCVPSRSRDNIINYYLLNEEGRSGILT